jgi:rhomboid family GlyGly-CTERM serine protease
MAIKHPVGRFKFDWPSLNRDVRYGLALVAVAFLLLLPEALGEGGRATLRFDREAIAAGEWWRLLSAHVVHLGLRHALLNAGGVILLGILFARDFAALRWVSIVVLAVAAVDAGLWLFDPGLGWYVGASGALHGVMAAGAWSRIRKQEWEGWVFGGFLGAKLLYEHYVGPMPFSSASGTVVVSAHLYGAIGGLAGAMLRSRRGSL